MSWSHYVLRKQLQLRWGMNHRPTSAWYYLQFPWQNWKHWRKQRPRELRHFTCWCLFPFFSTRNIIYGFLCWELVDPFVYQRFCKVLCKSISIQINCKGLQSPEICHFEIWNLLSHQLWLKRQCFQPPK